MKIEDLTKEIYTKLESGGIKGSIVSVRHLIDLKKEIERQYEEGFFDKEFYQERLSYFEFSVPESLPGAKSIIVVTALQPQVRVTFIYYGEACRFLIPPTYSNDTDNQALDLLRSVLEPQGYSLAETRLPEKLLAVHSGLARYGKNNIAYVDGMGSFHRPKAFYTDFPCLQDNWGELRVLESCERCSACLGGCPAGAISRDRFLIRAERCLTFHNERANEFPEWINPSWHNCLIGCLRCQTICPENRNLIGWIEDQEEFSHEETGFILQGKSRAELPAETVEKLERLNMLEDLGLLPRNLGALFNKRQHV